MSLSVIIPVYNAEKFLKRAIDSVLAEPEVTEIILVEDGSPDNSIQICEEYSKKYPQKVKFYQHPDKQNRGAGASRNLGIQMAIGKYIAFLDADDFYLPQGFKEAMSILHNNPEIDGTYGILGVHFDSDEVKQKYNSNGRFDKPTGIMTYIAPEDLFLKLIEGDKGYFSIVTLVVKKELIEKCNYFNASLKQGQDTDLIFKMVSIGKFTSSSLDKIVAMRGVHDDNRIHNTKEASSYHINLVPSFLEWAKTKDIKLAHKNRLIKKFHNPRIKNYSMNSANYFWKLTYLKTFFKHKIMFNYSESYLIAMETVFGFELIKFILQKPFWIFSSKRRKSGFDLIKTELKGNL